LAWVKIVSNTLVWTLSAGGNHLSKVILGILAAVVMSVLLGAAPSIAFAQENTHDLATGCGDLVKVDFSGIPDAPTHIIRGEILAPTSSGPAYCKVSGFIEPRVGIEMRLPVKNWNGKFMEKGCGGWCGAIMDWACIDALNRGYACITTDMGHKGSSMDDVSWANNNLQGQIDFGYRATHVAALAGKAIAARYYGALPKRSYFVGCSTGGYQGVMEAQRFPWDFDGIVAGAPDIDETQANFRALWVAKVQHDQRGHIILGENELALLHNAALALCDEDDGVKDGIISNPRVCKFKPETLLCKPGKSLGCLTSEQINVANKIYSGPINSAGETTSTGSFLIGSELGWSDLWPTASLIDYFRYGVPGYSTNPRFKDADFDFDQDYKRFGLAPQYDNSNPNLRNLKAAGTKFIIYHGMTDTIDPPSPVIDYYETVEKTMGGRENTQSFFRLFLIPGMNHCGGGAGVMDVDWIGALEEWVEKGKAPGVVIGAHPAHGKEPRFTRPLYPYPDYAKYKGSGDVNQAENFDRASGSADQ